MIDLSKYKLDDLYKKEINDDACDGCVFLIETQSGCKIKNENLNLNLNDIGCIDAKGERGPYIYVKSITKILKKL